MIFLCIIVIIIYYLIIIRVHVIIYHVRMDKPLLLLLVNSWYLHFQGGWKVGNEFSYFRTQK